jgi:diguanylate cyclase (GGDEF)-like protein
MQEGDGWGTLDVPTRPAGPHPLSRNGVHSFHDEATPDPERGGYAPDDRLRGDLIAPPTTDGTADSSKLIRLHESIGALLASRGEWEQAYEHLRSALDLVYSDRVERPPVPEQLRREVDRLRKEHAEAREQSIRDSLTASYNRRYLDQRLTSLLADTARAAQRGTSRAGLAVALADLDWFKQVNDTFGHLLGDRVLQRVVDLLSDDLPDGAFCARYGGEEFVLVVPNIDATAAVAVAEAARARIEHHPWSTLVPGLRVTVSIGLAHASAGSTASTSAEQQLLRADGLLYAAKQSGRNAVAYRHAGRVLLAGDGRRIAESRVAVTPER